jgi:hypothetical protein
MNTDPEFIVRLVVGLFCLWLATVLGFIAYGLYSNYKVHQRLEKEEADKKEATP